MLLCGSPFATNAPAAHCSYTMTSKHTIEVTAPVVSAHRHQMYQLLAGEREREIKKKKSTFCDSDSDAFKYTKLRSCAMTRAGTVHWHRYNDCRFLVSSC